MNFDIKTLAAIRYAYGGGNAFDPDYQAYLDYLTTNAITLPTTDQQTKQNTLVSDVKTALGGDWSRVKSCRLYAGSNADAALVDVKRLFVMSAVNSPSYSASLGYQGNGTTSYIDNGFLIASLYPTATEQRNSGLIVAVTANPPSANANFRHFMGAPNFSALQDTGENQRRAFSFSATGAFITKTVTYPDVIGASRSDNVSNENHRLGVAPSLTAGTSTTSTSHNSRDCGRSGASPVFSTVPIGVAIYTDNFSDAEFQAIAAAIQTYLS